MKRILLLFILLFILSCKKNLPNSTKDELAIVDQKDLRKQKVKVDHQIRKVKKAVIVPKLDGKMNDPIWEEAIWYGF